MIIVEKIRWANFLASGNSFTEITINDSKLALISGENGSGKSTIIDALCYGFFNKAFRKINKPQLVNSINGKNMVVEIYFNANNHKYIIRRGQKPAIFEIYSNGQLINQSADSRDYQDVLEKNILKLNYKTFCQIVVLGNANFTPFMQLPAAARREIIEDLLDIQVFSKMNILLKEKIQENKNATTQNEYEINICKNTINLNEQHNNQLKKNVEAHIQNKNKQIVNFNEENISLNEKIFNNNNKLEKYNAVVISNQQKIEQSLHEAQSIRSRCEKRIEKSKKEIAFYSDSICCPTCEQGISEEFKHSQVTSRSQTIETNENKLNQINNAISKLIEKQKCITSTVEKIQEITLENKNLISQINLNKRFVDTLEQEIVNLKKDKEEIKPNNEEKQKLKLLENQKKTLIDQRELYSVVSVMLKDGGIKTQIVKQYIPIINKLINYYLEQMEFFCQFELNESFEEKIKSRYRDEFSYDSFSEGEKMRINLALLWTWREIARIRNSASCNLLLLDEIMDSSLDSQGTEEFIKIIQELSKNNNVIIISHKTDQIQDRFDKVIKFEKYKNFSTLKG